MKLLSLPVISRSSGASWSPSAWRRESFAQTATQYSRVVAQGRTHCLSGRATVGLGLRWRRRRSAPRCLHGGAHGRRVPWDGRPSGSVRVWCWPRCITPSPTSRPSKPPPPRRGLASRQHECGRQTFPGFGTNTPGNPAYPNATIQFSATNVPLCAVDTASISMIGSSGRFRASVRPSSSPATSL